MNLGLWSLSQIRAPHTSSISLDRPSTKTKALPNMASFKAITSLKRTAT